MIQWKRKPFFGVEKKNKKKRKKTTLHVTPVPGEGDQEALCRRQSTIRPKDLSVVSFLHITPLKLCVYV